MRRFVVVTASVVAALLAFSGAQAEIEPDSVICGQISPGGAVFAALVCETGASSVVITGFVRSGTSEPIPFSGTAILTPTRLSFTMAGGNAQAGVFTLVGKFVTGEPHGDGACFGPSPCSASGQPVTYTLTAECPLT